MSISIVMLAYKEAENLNILLPQLHETFRTIGCAYEIIIIDSAVPLDDTENVCALHHAKYYPQEEPGYAGAFRTGIRYATMERTLVLDADGSHDPVYIPDLYRMHVSGNYDIVIGSRYTKGGQSNDSTTSFVMSKVLNTVMRICIGVKAKDISTSFRIYYTKQLQEVTLTRNNYDVLQEVILRIKVNKRNQHQKLTIGETPIIFHKRLLGESKRKLFKFICGYVASVAILLQINIKSLLTK